jgi:hypothetical protein
VSARHDRRAASVDAWLSPHCRTEFSVSICDDDGEEIECIGGADDADKAFELAREYAESRGVPARLMPDESGRVARAWDPPANGEEVQS